MFRHRKHKRITSIELPHLTPTNLQPNKHSPALVCFSAGVHTGFAQPGTTAKKEKALAE
jgi:hypothetical protein